MALDKTHYVNLRNGRFDSTTADDLATLFATFEASGKRHLVVHIHGGLVNEKTGMAIAERLLPEYERSGAYPVFFVWEAGLDEVLLGNLREIFGERIFQRLLLRVAQFVKAKLKRKAGTRGTRLELDDEFDVEDELRQGGGAVTLGALPRDGAEVEPALDAVEEAQLYEVLEMDFVLQQEAEAVANALRPAAEIAAERRLTRGATVRASRHTLMSPEVLDEIREGAPDPTERGFLATAKIIARTAAVINNVLRRLSTGRDHGVYATIVEEILRGFYLANAGRFVWSTMKRDTLDAFGGDAAVHGGTAFLNRLASAWEADPDLEVTLVGHSTGAIYICYLLQAADAVLPQGAAFNVVFLAPAVDMALFHQTLTDVDGRIARHAVDGGAAGDGARSIRVFNMLDETERADALVPVVYPHSLLYFVSGVCEEEVDAPLLGMQRYFSGTAPYEAEALRAVKQALEEVDGLCWAPTVEVRPGRNTGSKKHGDFDNDPTTVASVIHLLQHGFTA